MSLWLVLSPESVVGWQLTIVTDCVTIVSMIKSFRCKETERLFHREITRRLPSEILEAARMKLEMLDAAEVIEDLRVPPSNHLEKLSGKRSGQHSIRINRQWRICFRWQSGSAHEVEIVDYH